MTKRRSEVLVVLAASALVSAWFYRDGGGSQPTSPAIPSPTPALAVAQGQSSLLLKSDPQEYIGGGKEWHFTAENATFEDGGPGTPVILKVHTQDGEDLELDFAAPRGDALRVGRYEGARRWFASEKVDRPGLDINGWHRGSNRLKGSFEVLEIAYGPQGPTRFAADFVQYGEEMATQRLQGKIRYHSVIP